MAVTITVELLDRASENFAKLERAAAQSAKVVATETEKAARQAEHASESAARAATLAWQEFQRSSATFGSSAHQAYVDAQSKSVIAVQAAVTARAKSADAAVREKQALQQLDTQLEADRRSFRHLIADSGRAKGEFEAFRELLGSARNDGEKLQYALNMGDAMTSLKKYNSELEKLSGIKDLARPEPRSPGVGKPPAEGVGSKVYKAADFVGSLNLFDGKELEGTVFSGVADVLGKVGGKVPQIGVAVNAVTTAVYGTAKALKILEDHGSSAAAEVNKRFSEFDQELKQIGHETAESLASAFDDTARTIGYMAEQIGIGVQQTNALAMANSRQAAAALMRDRAEQKQWLLRRDAMAEQVRAAEALEKADAARARRTMLANVGQDFTLPEAPKRSFLDKPTEADRKARDVALEMLSGSGLSPTEEAAKAHASRAARADDAAKRSVESDEIAKLKAQLRDEDLAGSGSARRRKQLEEKKDGQGNESELRKLDREDLERADRKKQIEEDIAKIKEAQAHRIEYIQALEDKAVADERERMNRQRERRERDEERARKDAEHASREKELDDAATLNRAVQISDQHAGFLRADAERERQYAQQQRDSGRDTATSREQSQEKIKKLEDDAKRLDEERYQMQREALRAMHEKQTQELEATRQMREQRELALEAAKNDNARRKAMEDLNKQLKKEDELREKVKSTSASMGLLERQRKDEISQQGVAEARREEERAQRRTALDRDRKAGLVDQQAQSLAQTGKAGLEKFVSGIDPRSALMFAARQKSIRDQGRKAMAGKAVKLKGEDKSIDDMSDEEFDEWSAESALSKDRALRPEADRAAKLAGRRFDRGERGLMGDAAKLTRDARQQIEEQFQSGDLDAQGRAVALNDLRAKSRGGGFLEDARENYGAMQGSAVNQVAAYAAQAASEMPGVTQAQQQAYNAIAQGFMQMANNYQAQVGMHQQLEQAIQIMMQQISALGGGGLRSGYQDLGAGIR